MPGGSTGFNAPLSGWGSFWFKSALTYLYDITDTIYVFSNINKEVRFLSQTTRPYFDRLQLAFYFSIQGDYDGLNRLWGSLDDYYYARCVKEE